MNGLILFLVKILNFVNKVVIPLILGIAFLVFIFNAFRFFFLEGASTEGREKGRKLMLWGLLGFIVIVSLWSIVNLLVFELGFGRERVVTPDYIESERPQNTNFFRFWNSSDTSGDLGPLF